MGRGREDGDGLAELRKSTKERRKTNAVSEGVWKGVRTRTRTQRAKRRRSQKEKRKRAMRESGGVMRKRESRESGGGGLSQEVGYKKQAFTEEPNTAAEGMKTESNEKTRKR